MHRIFLLSILVLTVNVCSQEKGDSLFTGRTCKVLLHNGFEAEGIITKTAGDTIWLKTDIKEFKIPVSEIKFVLNPEADIPELEETDLAPSQSDTTEKCNLYLSGGKLLKDVKLIYQSDSTLLALKESKARVIKIEDVRKIVFTAGSGFWKGFLIGDAVGLGSGLLFGILISSDEGSFFKAGFGEVLGFGFIFALPAGLAGGVIGAIADRDVSYTLPDGYSVTKAKRVQYIIKKHIE
ncbi:MAG: hypothetical protein L0Y79_00455 [Chlorobi bacterium]|nr:hypothetical protein [Chlorobiota bacterium]MCI0714886.1 hypothetical protein [Chlorobiota bacterium]